jgi:hypothetical protein
VSNQSGGYGARAVEELLLAHPHTLARLQGTFYLPASGSTTTVQAPAVPPRRPVVPVGAGAPVGVARGGLETNQAEMPCRLQRQASRLPNPDKGANLRWLTAQRLGPAQTSMTHE